ncbi:DUF3783 domain-containing protein [Haloimpatiens sp. FM7315]|uniref:DUF3783 domain-containing protein n=1 Tax=Haloimpatiens sp. FM7315 TaxID=3298609 RepID=UPI0035A330B5
MVTLNNDSFILAYGFNDEETAFLTSLVGESSLKIIEKSMANTKIKDIIEGIYLPVYDKNMPEDKVILFNNVEDKKVDLLVKDIRTNEAIKCILAVVTPTSSEWTLKKLLKELLREREWFKNNSNKRA